METILCGKPMPKATNGNDRGLCNRPPHGRKRCGTSTCYACGILLVGNASPTAAKRGQGFCRPCNAAKARKKFGYQILNRQVPGQHHTFSCGCNGTLPTIKGESNRFVKGGKKSKSGWNCRVAAILISSKILAKKRDYCQMDSSTSHLVIREMMDKPCIYCGTLLDWSEFKVGKTPHLDHDHETGVINGFAHPVCNPRALKDEIDKLRVEIKRLSK